MIDETRCQWCQVKLRWWQISHCRLCATALKLDTPGPPCHSGERFYQRPDKFRFPTWFEGNDV